MTLAANQVKSLQIGELVSISLIGSPKLGKTTTFHLVKGNVEGQDVSNVRRVRGPTHEGLLQLEINGVQKSRFKLQLDIAPSTNTFSVLMYNVGVESETSIPGLKSPIKLSGPSFIFLGPGIYAYDGEREVATNSGFIIKGHPLMVFLVGGNIMIQNQFKRKSFKLPPVVSGKNAVVMATINIVNESGPHVLESMTNIPYSNL